MANSQELQDIISLSSNKSIVDARTNLNNLNKELQDTIVLSSKVNDTLAGAKTMGDINKASLKQQEAQEKLLTLTAKRQIAEEKLTSFKTQQQSKLDAIEAKQLKADNDRISRIKRIEDAEIARIKKAEQSANKEIANSKQITAAQANEAAAISSTTRAETVKRNLKKLSNLEQEKANQLAIIDRANLKATAKEQNAVKGSLEQRQLALARLQKTYTLLSAEERKSAFGQRLGTVIPQLNSQVLTLEKSLGKSQREVGNYGNAFTRSAGKAFSGLRMIANILPGVGLAGLIGFAVEPIINYISQLDIFKTKISEVAAVGGAISSEYKKATADVTALGVSIQEYQKGTISKTELVQRFNETIGQTVGKLTTAAQVEDFYNKQATNFVKATLMRAEAQSALNVVTEKRSEALKKKIEGASFFDYLKGIGLAIAQNRTFSVSSIKLNAELSKLEGVAGLANQAKEAKIEYERLQKAADDFAKSVGLNFRVPTENKNAIKKSAADLIQIQIEAQKKIADTQRAIADDEANGYFVRLDAQEKFEAASIKIAELTGQKQKITQKRTANGILAINAATETEKNKITLESLKFQDKLYAKSIEEQNKIIKEGKKELKILLDQDVSNILKRSDIELEKIENNRAFEEQQVSEKYAKNLISKKQYEAEIDKINRDAALNALNEQISTNDAIIKLQQEELDLYGIGNQEEIDANIRKNTALKIRLSKLGFDEEKKLQDRMQAEKEAIAEKEKQLLQDVFNFSNQLINQSFQNRIDKFEKEKEDLQARTQLEIENVEESVLSEQDKKDRIGVINAQAASKQEAIDAKIKEEKRKQAIADKAAAIGQAIINIALAQTKTLGTLGFLGLPLNALVAAIGALQIASIIATPIPKFAKGTENSPEGLAYVGERGTEGRVNPDGSFELTPNKTTLTYLEKGTKIIPNHDLVRMMAKPDTTGAVGGKSWDVSAIVNSNERTAGRIEKAITRIKVPSTVITERGFMAQTARMDKHLKRVNKNFNRK